MRSDCNYTYHVADKCGAAAGNGGKAANGGYSGTVHIFDLIEPAKINAVAAKGADGLDGKAGAPASNPKKMLLRYWQHSSSFASFRYNQRSNWFVEGEEEDETCQKIDAAANGGNAKGLRQPEEASDFDLATPIIQYLDYLRERQIDNLRSDELNAFAQQIQTDDRILHNFTTLGFINELRSLEIQFFEFQNRIDFAPYYHAVCQRIEAYVRDAPAEVMTREARKVSVECKL